MCTLATCYNSDCRNTFKARCEAQAEPLLLNMTDRAQSLRPNPFSLKAHHTNWNNVPDNAKPKGGTKNEATGIRPSTNLMVTHPLKAQTWQLTYKLTKNSSSDITPCQAAAETKCRLSGMMPKAACVLWQLVITATAAIP